MAKKRARQTKFCDTFDELPQEVQNKVKEYSNALSERLAWQDYENTYRAELLGLMHAHNLRFVPDPQDDEKVFALSIEDPKESIKKMPKTKVLAEQENARSRKAKAEAEAETPA